MSFSLFTIISSITPIALLVFWNYFGVGKSQCFVAWLNIQGTLFLAYSVELQHGDQIAEGLFQPASINKKHLIVGLCFLIGSTFFELLAPTLLK